MRSARAFTLYEQYQIEILINKGSVGSFIARQNEANTWEVEFSVANDLLGKIMTRRGEQRFFARINGVMKWMQEVGIKEFRVVLA